MATMKVCDLCGTSAPNDPDSFDNWRSVAISLSPIADPLSGEPMQSHATTRDICHECYAAAKTALTAVKRERTAVVKLAKVKALFAPPAPPPPDEPFVRGGIFEGGLGGGRVDIETQKELDDLESANGSFDGIDQGLVL